MSKTAAYKIFNIYYECYVANMHLVSDEQLDVYGSLTNDPNTDRALAHENSVALLNIATIADFHDQSITVTLVDPAKSKDIYELIVEHLTDWQNHLMNNHNGPGAPQEDLRKLDNLAGDVLNTARGYIKEPMARPTFFKEPTRRPGRRMARPETAEVAEVRVQTIASTHTPVADAIARINFKRRRGDE